MAKLDYDALNAVTNGDRFIAPLDPRPDAHVPLEFEPEVTVAARLFSAASSSAAGGYGTEGTPGDDVLAMATRPVVVSHTGVQGTCPGPRNLSDAHVQAIAAQGGVIGIAYFQGAVCALGTEAIVKAIRHAVDLAGVKHVALGSDFDGAIRVPFDTTGLVLITQGLLEAGMGEDDIVGLPGQCASENIAYGQG